MIDTEAYKLLWSEAQQWIQTYIREIAESDLENEDLASKFVHVAEKAYYTNVEDYSPGTDDPLGLRGLQDSPELETLLSRIRATDRHEYAKEAIRQHYRETQKAS